MSIGSWVLIILILLIIVVIISYVIYRCSHRRGGGGGGSSSALKDTEIEYQRELAKYSSSHNKEKKNLRARVVLPDQIKYKDLSVF